METVAMNGIQPMYDLSKNDNGMGDSWIWILLILLLGGNGFGGNGVVQNDALMNQEFIKRDIFGTNQNVSNQGALTQRDVLESRYTTELGFKDAQLAQANCCCETNRNIDALRAEAYRNTCDITNTVREENALTRQLINDNTIQQLRSQLAESDRNLTQAGFQITQIQQTSDIINALRPTPIPSYPTCSPYASALSGGGCNSNLI